MPHQTQTSWVDLIEWDPMTGSGFVVVRAYLENGIVVLDGDKAVVASLLEGIVSVRPNDGMKFLEAMTNTFRNPYLLATSVQTGVMPKEFGLVQIHLDVLK